MMQEYKMIRENQQFRKFCRILQDLNFFPLIISAVAGLTGGIFYKENVIYGFNLFSWTVLTMFILLVWLFANDVIILKI